MQLRMNPGRLVKASGWSASSFACNHLPHCLAPRGPLIVMYHGIGGTDGVSPASMERHLIALKSRRRVIPLPEAVRMLGHPEAEDLAAVTFDDGYRDFAELALPILSTLRIHATLFVPGGLLGGTNNWDFGQVEERTIMTGRELRQLDPAAVTIGAHGFTHRRLSGIDAAALDTETAVARRAIEDVCGRRVTLFAYPYGQADDFDTAAERALEIAGFDAACSTCFGRGSRPSERFRLRRVGIMPKDSLEAVERKLDGAYDWIAWRERAGVRLRNWRRVMVGERG